MLIAFHKPHGVLSQFTAEAPGQRTLAEFSFPKNVYPIGRLDADSEGLLLLSDEPELNQRLLHPRHAHEREYWVQVERIPTSESLAKLSSGLVIQGRKTLPCRAWLLDPQPVLDVSGSREREFADHSPVPALRLFTNAATTADPTLRVLTNAATPLIPPRDPPIRFRKNVPDCWIGLELIEGKNRQVRRMTAAIGHPTLRLIRVRIGELWLGGLKPGAWKELDQPQRQLVLR